MVKNERSLLLPQIKNTIESLNELNRATTFESFSHCVSEEMLKPIMYVVLTGCGSSYQAAMAARALYEDTNSGTACGSIATTQRALYFSRYRNAQRGWHPVLTKRTLLAAISVSGNTDRTIEAVNQINSKGGNTVAFTSDRCAQIARMAHYTVPLNISGASNGGEIDDYSTTTFTAMLFGMYFSMLKGRLTPSNAETQRFALMQYINSFVGKPMWEMEEAAWKIAQDWKSAGVEYVDVVADGYEFAAAQFGADRMVGSAGLIAMVDDNEDWNHIPFWTKNPERVGTVLFANSSSPSFGRSVENAFVFDTFGRKLVVITDGPVSDQFPESATVIELPRPAFRWALPLMEHLPMSYIAAFLGDAIGGSLV